MVVRQPWSADQGQRGGLSCIRSSVAEAYLAKNNFKRHDGAQARTYAECLALAHPNYYPLNGDWPEVSDIIASSFPKCSRKGLTAMDEANAKIDRLLKQEGLLLINQGRGPEIPKRRRAEQAPAPRLAA